MTKHKEAFCLMWYACQCGHRERIWNSRDGVTPFGCRCPSCGDLTLGHTDFSGDVVAPNHKLHQGQKFWRDGAPDEAVRITQKRIEFANCRGVVLPAEHVEQMMKAAREGLDEWKPGWPTLDEAKTDASDSGKILAAIIEALGPGTSDPVLRVKGLVEINQELIGRLGRRDAEIVELQQFRQGIIDALGASDVLGRIPISDQVRRLKNDAEHFRVMARDATAEREAWVARGHAMTEELARVLPCPFCGEPPKVVPSHPEHDGAAWGAVRCVNKSCPAMPSVSDGEAIADERGSNAYKNAAIKRWNNRASGVAR